MHWLWMALLATELLDSAGTLIFQRNNSGSNGEWLVQESSFWRAFGIWWFCIIGLLPHHLPPSTLISNHLPFLECCMLKVFWTFYTHHFLGAGISSVSFFFLTSGLPYLMPSSKIPGSSAFCVNFYSAPWVSLVFFCHHLSWLPALQLTSVLSNLDLGCDEESRSYFFSVGYLT